MLNSTEQTAADIFTVTRAMKEHIAKEGVLARFSFPQIRALVVVEGQKGASMKAVAENLCITSPSATALIERLVKDGEIKRVSDKKDRRIVRLEITPKGKKALENGLKAAGKKMTEMMKVLSSEEKKSFGALLRKLSANI